MIPFIHLTEGISIPTYYLILSVAVSAALLWIVRRAHAQHLPQKSTLDVSLLIMIAGFLGGRLMHVIFEEPAYYRDNPLQIFAFWNGGFVFYGGALLAALVALVYLYKTERRDLGRYLDLFAPVLAFTYAMGRGACLLAGCCYGKYCELPWAIDHRHPTQIYAGVWELLVVAILLIAEKRKHRVGFIFCLWMTLHGLGRLVMEHFRDDFRGPQLGLSISSWISIGIILTGTFFIVRKPKG